MVESTTLRAHVPTAIPDLPGAEVAPQPSPRGLSVEDDGQRVRVRTAQLATQWLPDTPRHRHLAVVWFRLRVDAHGKALCTLPEVATLVESTNWPAASPPLEDCRACGADMRAFVRRKRKVEAAVVAGVLHALLQTPLASPTELGPRGTAPLGRDDLTAANLESAVEQLSGVPGLRTRRRQLAAGHVPYQEAWLLSEMRESLALPAPPPAGGRGPRVDRGRRIADPTALAARVTPDWPLAQVPGSLCWLTVRMTRF